MNLMKLLTVGQSLEEGKNVSGKYKLSQQSLLPKFAARVQPSSPAPTAESAEVKQAATVASQTPAQLLSPESNSGPAPTSRLHDKTQKIAAGTSLEREEKPAAIFPPISFRARVKNKISSAKNKIFHARPRKNSFAPIQTEWALEKIKVARNDLNDSDLEVVSAKTPAAASAAKPTLTDPHELKNSSGGWIKLTARLFKPSSPFEKRAPEKPSACTSEMTSRSPFAGRT